MPTFLHVPEGGAYIVGDRVLPDYFYPKLSQVQGVQGMEQWPSSWDFVKAALPYIVVGGLVIYGLYKWSR